MKKIALIAKTNLNNDGRILNELRILRSLYRDTVLIDFILMPDRPLKIEVDDIDKIHFVDTSIRNNKWLRPLTVLVFTLKALSILKKIEPDVVHAQDSAVALPVFLYKKFVNKHVKIIYDDHELPNENEPLFNKIMHLFENKLMKASDFILFANAERREYLIRDSGTVIKSKSDYLLNLPYFEESEPTVTLTDILHIGQLKKDKGLKFIMHQGVLGVDRGRSELAKFSLLLPEHFLILIVGVSKEDFAKFLDEYNLDATRFYYIGLVPYNKLNEYWTLADASIIIYLSDYINNRLCAPNRLYISFNHSLPILVNRDNPVLSNFVKSNQCGMFIEDISKENIHTIFNFRYSASRLNQLKEGEMKKFKNIYTNLFSG